VRMKIIQSPNKEAPTRKLYAQGCVFENESDMYEAITGRRSAAFDPRAEM